MSFDVSISACPDYSAENVRRALAECLDAVGGLDWVTPGMKIAVKANLVIAMKPDTAAVTHPSVVTELCRMLVSRGAEVIVGDSPGGLWNSAWVGYVYTASGIREVESIGASLNRDFGETEIEFPDAAAAKKFFLTSWLLDVDCIIDCCKLKTHAFMAMSCAVKNFFGAVPGARKPEYHYLYPQLSSFADMLIDLNLFLKPCLTVVDAVMGMEGNGPTQGTPRHLGAILASRSTFAADLACVSLIGLDPMDVPTVKAAFERGLAPASPQELSVYGDLASFAVPDYVTLPIHEDMDFRSHGPVINWLLRTCFATRPKIDRSICVGCGKCAEACPVHASKVVDRKAEIDKSVCIRCFCCQEFCPKGAISVHRPAFARLLGK